MFSVGSDFDMVECPYNKTHRMQRKRLQPHLIKCRLNYPDAELQKCPFNSTHLIPEPEFTMHVTSCSDRKLITQYKYDAPVVKEEDRVKHAPIECEDNWDDTEAEDYNPQTYAANANVLRRPDSSKPAERKAFCKQERRRLGDCDSDDDEPTNEYLVKKEKEDPCTADEQDDERLPRTPPPPQFSDWDVCKGRHRSRSRSPHHSGHHLPTPPPYTSRYFHDRTPSPRRTTVDNYRQPSPPVNERYDPDYDPYYNSSSDGRWRESRNEDGYGYNASPLSYGAVPSRRGAHRGYPYDRRSGSQRRGR